MEGRERVTKMWGKERVIKPSFKLITIFLKQLLITSLQDKQYKVILLLNHAKQNINWILLAIPKYRASLDTGSSASQVDVRPDTRVQKVNI